MNPLLIYRAAADLHRRGAELVDEQEITVEEAAALGERADAASFEALRGKIHVLREPLVVQWQRMEAIARVLEASGELAELLDSAIARVAPLVGYLPFARDTLQLLRGLGTALDVACAQQITSLCTPESPEPVMRMSHLKDLDSRQLHEFHLMFADDWVRGLVDKHPGLLILEHPEDGLVAFLPADPQAGDPVSLEDVETVTTYVPGVGSADPQSWSTHIERTSQLARAVGGDSAGGIVWLGRHTPSNLINGLQREPATRAGKQLSELHAELHRRAPEQRRVTVGFSYGAAIASEAALHQGLHSDDLLLLGSPGSGAAHAGELKLYGDHPCVHVMTSPGDPITLINGPNHAEGPHGTDPTHPSFGAQVHDPGVTGDHGSYFEDEGFYAAVEEALRTSRSASGRS